MSVDVLRSFALLKGLDDEALSVFSDSVEALSFSTGDRLFEEDDPADGLLFLVEGVLRLESQRHGHCGMVGPGTTLGGASLVAPGVRELSAEVERDCELLWLSESGFKTLVDDDPRAGYQLLEAIARELAICTRATLDSLQEDDAGNPHAS